MMDFLKSFKSLVKVEKVHTDNNVFKLHYKFTVIMLIVFSILLTSKQYFGEPIQCDGQEKLKKILDTICWVNGTYTIESKKTEGLSGLGNETGKRVIWHQYYQWVSIVFCFQALLFYLPRYLWKLWEGGRMRLLIKDISGPLVTNAWNDQSKTRLVHYMVGGKYSHNVYAARYALCEAVNFINVISQIFLIDWLITGQFTMYGIAFAFFADVNPMNKVFPKVAKCRYENYGPSGGVQTIDALCVLPLNILNEKLFLILWVWLFFLTFVSLCTVIYRIALIFVPKFRYYLLRAQVRDITAAKAQAVVKKLSYGDFFVLYHIGKNTNPIVYSELVLGIYDMPKRSLKGSPLYDCEKFVVVTEAAAK